MIRAFICFFFGLLTVVTTSQSFGQAALPSGLVGHWTFDGQLDDLSGMGNHGSLIGGAQLVSDLGSNLDSAVQLGGPAQFVEFSGNSAALQSPLPVTVLLSIRIDDAPSFGAIAFSSCFTFGVYHGVWISIDPSLVWAASFGTGGGIAPSGRRSAGTTVPLQQGAWVHLAGVVRGPSDFSLYQDGQLVPASFSGTGGGTVVYDPSSPGVLALTDSGPFNTYLEATIDNVMLFDRELTPRRFCRSTWRFTPESFSAGTSMTMARWIWQMRLRDSPPSSVAVPHPVVAMLRTRTMMGR